MRDVVQPILQEPSMKNAVWTFVALFVMSLAVSCGGGASTPGGEAGTGGSAAGAAGSAAGSGGSAAGSGGSAAGAGGSAAGASGAAGAGGAMTTPECTPPMPATASCFKAGGGNTGLCDVSYQTGSTLMLSCTPLGGTFNAGPCPQANQIGTCMASNKLTAKVYYGTKGTEASYLSFCRNAGDTWCP
jgi:hypothetical protein